MPGSQLVVSDTSPLLNLALIDRLREAGFWISDELYSKILSEAEE